MNKVLEGYLYAPTHEWAKVEGNTATFGITEFAQDQLSDIVFVELPQLGDTFDQGQVYAVVESVKAASDCYTPVGGEVVEINEELESTPGLVNQEPYGSGWFVKVRLSDSSQLDDLRDAESYSDLLRQLTEEE